VTLGDRHHRLDFRNEALRFAGDVVEPQKVSGLVVVGSQSANFGSSHFQARGQLSRFSCRVVQTTPALMRAAFRSAMER
jgi:hypothetical protein